MQQLSHFRVLALIVLFHVVLLLQSAKASLEHNEKASQSVENEDNVMYTDMLASMLQFINEHKNLEMEKDEIEQINQNEVIENSEIMYPRNSEQQTYDQSVTSNSFNMAKRPFFNDHNVPYKNKLSYIWGSNPNLWQTSHQPITAELPTTLSHSPAIISPESRWASNPSFWGKRDFWTTRGKKPYKAIGSISKIVEKDPDNLAFWKSRGKRDEERGHGRISRSPWAPEDRVMEPNYWPNRGKKAEISDATKRSNFKRELAEYWTTRGRRRMDEKQWKPSITEEGGIPYWVPRGKKNIEASLGRVQS